MLVSLSELESLDWWKKQSPYGVISMMWGSTRFIKVREAAMAVTSRFLEKLDTDGIQSPRISFSEYVLKTYSEAVIQKSTLIGNPVSASVLAYARAITILAFPSLLDRKLTKGLSKLPLLAAETPIAVERCRRFIESFGYKTPRIECVPHAVDETEIKLDSAVKRKNQIISVGRWADYQKNFPLLLKLLNEFLKCHPNWEANVIGRLPKNISDVTRSLSSTVIPRIKFSGIVPHDQLSMYYQESKIFLMSSRYESFGIAAAEALYCGCSVVGPAKIASVPFFTNDGCGTCVKDYTEEGLTKGLEEEVFAWENDVRESMKIANKWKEIVGSRVVMMRLLHLLQEIRA